jgi:hypothetical protein
MDSFIIALAISISMFWFASGTGLRPVPNQTWDRVWRDFGGKWYLISAVVSFLLAK